MKLARRKLRALPRCRSCQARQGHKAIRRGLCDESFGFRPAAALTLQAGLLPIREAEMAFRSRNVR